MEICFRNIVLSIVLLGLSICALSQSNTTWDLEKCIDQGLNNNLDLKTANLSLIQSEVNKNQAKYSYLPTLNAGATHGYNWGQSIDPFTNQFASDRVRSNSMYLSSNVTLFSGLRNYYTNQKNNSEFLIQKYSQQIQQRDLRINVAGLFLQALMNYKTIGIAQEQIKYSLKQQERINLLVSEEQKTKYDLLEVKSQLGLDSLAWTKARNEYSLSILQLKQFLNLKSNELFEIDTTFGSYALSNKASPIDLNQLDENLLVKEQINTQLQNVKIAQSARYPSLTLSGSIGSGYSGNNKEVVGTEFLPKPFNIQAQENFYQTATLSLNIPIFNGNQVNSQVQLANIEMDKAKIEKERTLQKIENSIEQLNIEILNANSQIKSTEKVLYSLKQNLEVAVLKYEEGLMNFPQFLEIKNILVKTEMELLQAKFTYYFKVKILEFYSK